MFQIKETNALLDLRTLTTSPTPLQAIKTHFGDIQENISKDSFSLPQHAQRQPEPWCEGGHQEQLRTSGIPAM